MMLGERRHIQEAMVRIGEEEMVSEVSLRQWTDEGRLRAFITPGGHRRYARAGLRKFMSARMNM